ncbi:EamA family transporter [Candidatus Chloroploca sp. Khr17]|uniref:EamA family transporter n=1 Tax=Candidatus Chloroploca sp. Khr17 TaxID=2496869 RepID=UPI001F0FE397|nr:EamA family transporter [Candidatus Chloroploca sp. Khr17]
MSSSVTPVPTTTRDDSSNDWIWMGMALLAHTGWGAYPVLARYLQTVTLLPSMSLLAFGNLIALAVFAPFVLRRLDGRFLLQPAIWAFAFFVVLRAITNVLAARYTLAVYVQLITLMTPLLVALLSFLLFRDRLPPYTWTAIGFSLLGSLLLMSGDLAGQGFTLVLTASDWLGIGLALVSAISLAFYMILIPRTVKSAIPGEAVMLVQLTVLTLTTGMISLMIGEDWSRYAVIGATDWAIFFGFVVFVMLGSNLGQIAALRHLGAPLVSSTMAWRLIATLVLAALLLGERLTSFWQALGALIVLATITIYLRLQRSF